MVLERMDKRPSFLSKQADDLAKIEKEAVEGKAVVIEDEGAVKLPDEVKEPDKPIIPEGGENEAEEEKAGSGEPPVEIEAQKTDLEVQRLNDSLNQFKGMIESQNRTIESLQAIILKLQEPKIEKSPDKVKVEEAAVTKIDDKDLDDYDPKIAEVIKAHNAQVDIIEELKAKIGTLEQSNEDVSSRISTVSTAVEQNKGESFWGKVRGEVEDFDAINGDSKGQNADPRWSKYLEEVEPVSRMKRRDIAALAIRNKDHGHLTELVNDFKQTVDYKKPETQKKKGLEGQVIPDVKGAKGGSDKGGSTKLITKAQFDKAANDRAHRKITDAEFEKIAKGYELTLQQQAQGAT
jgi:prefoldin subunit 5